MGHYRLGEEELNLRLEKLRSGRYSPQKFEEEQEEEKREENIDFSYRKLSKNEKKQLRTYIDYAGKYMKNLERGIKGGKKCNFEFLGEYGEYFPGPGLLLREVSLDNPRGLFEYYKNSIKVFREILKRGTITSEQEEALELRLNEEIDEEAFANSL